MYSFAKKSAGRPWRRAHGHPAGEERGGVSVSLPGGVGTVGGGVVGVGGVTSALRAVGIAVAVFVGVEEVTQNRGHGGDEVHQLDNKLFHSD